MYENFSTRPYYRKLCAGKTGKIELCRWESGYLQICVNSAIIEDKCDIRRTVMREKTDRLAKGIFEYKTSSIKVSPEVIELEVDAGEQCEGSFVIHNTAGRVMNGVVTTDCHYIDFVEDEFHEVSPEISFQFDGKRFMQGETVKGTICVISDCGTTSIPFTINISVPSCTVPSGKIKDLFHFANLAREDSKEAVKLFKSENFEEVFLYRDNVNIALYRGLLASTGKSLAVEEFLISIHKKLPIQISVNKSALNYNNCTKDFSDEIIITKDNWGFGEFHIQSDAAFLIPEHKIIWTDNFDGDKYKLNFKVDTSKMVAGTNYGRITISTVRQNINIDVTAVKPGMKHENVIGRLKVQNSVSKLMQLYLEFCMNRMDKEAYIRDIKEIIADMNTTDTHIMYELFRVHMGIMSNEDSVVKDGMEYFASMESELLKKDKKYYCAYQYLKGLWSDDNDVKDACVKNVRDCYDEKENNWQILWFLLYLDPVYDEDERKLEDIYKQLRNGCQSPVLYFEICNILNESPVLLSKLNRSVCRCLKWGAKHDFIDRELALRYAYLAGHLKNYSRTVLSDLCMLYKKYEEDDILAVICRTYMKGQITSQEAFYWYSLGVGKNLKITDLYEFYMYSIDETQTIQLNSSVLLYFLYDNHLTVAKKAMLYAYIIKNKSRDADTYRSYKDAMREFCFQELKAGRINENLAIIYEEFIDEESITAEVARQLPRIMFCQEITCNNPSIAGVYVRHRELKGEEFVPLVHGKAIVTIFTEQSRVFLADGLDNRYVQSIDYTMNKLVHLDRLADKCFEKNHDDIRLTLHLYDKIEHFHQAGEFAAEVRRCVMNIEELSDYQRRRVFSSSVRYYYDNFDGDLLDEALNSIDWTQVNGSDREQFMEYCAVRHCYDKAMEGIFLYGYDKISGKRLLQISSDTFKKEAENENKVLVKLGWHIFNQGKFDENILKYLCSYFMGGIYEEVSLWKAAHGFGIECKGFEERILGQIVFTEEIAPEAYDVFYSYYEDGTNKKLIRAFLKMIAYKYLVKSWIIPEKIFQYFYSEVRVQENIPCLIAALKYLSKKKNLTEEQKNFAAYNINQLYEKGMVFPFFKDFYGSLPLPVHILDQHYVEYTADPKCEVKIHYLISSDKDESLSDENYVTETMHNVFEGIRVKEFVMFQDELLQYYITETDSSGERVTKSVSIHFDESMDNARVSSRYHTLNTMMIAKEMGDDATLLDMMEEYVVERENVAALFKPLS